MADILALPFGMFDSVTYLIRMPGSVCLIDPSAPVARLPRDLPPVSLILATHGHIDHLDQSDVWRSQTGSPLAIHGADAPALTDPAVNLSGMMGRRLVFQPAQSLLEDHQLIVLDETHSLEVLHTPGHTPGCCCFLLQEEGQARALFSGDTLFAGSIGRLDLPGASQQAMQASLRRLAGLARSLDLSPSHDLPVYPGHGPATGLYREIQRNPFFSQSG